MRYAFPIETDELCSYGCGQIAKFKNKSNNLMCCDFASKCPENKRKNKEGLESAYRTGIRKPAKGIYENLPEETKKRMNWNKGLFTNTIFEYNGSGNHKGFLIQERGYKCEECGLTEWLNKPITLELEHIDGDNRNNAKDNLKLLCPNCHSYTDTWKGRNSVNLKTRNYVSDKDFKEALRTTKNIRQALLKLKLTPKGANYIRANELLLEIKGDMEKLVNSADLEI